MKNAIKQYQEARTAHIAARDAQEAARKACFSIPLSERRERLEEAKKIHAAHDAACYAEERALRIRKAAAYIAEQKIKAAAAPVVAATLKKYQGKAAGPKTREKAAAEIAAALGVKSAYFSSGYYGGPVNHVTIYIDHIYGNEVSPEIYTRGMEKMIDENNRFCAAEIDAPDLDALPEDLEAWADEFDTAAGELEAARAAFDAAAAHARRVNLGEARLKEYRITGY